MHREIRRQGAGSRGGRAGRIGCSLRTDRWNLLTWGSNGVYLFVYGPPFLYMVMFIPICSAYSWHVVGAQ